MREKGIQFLKSVSTAEIRSGFRKKQGLSRPASVGHVISTYRSDTKIQKALLNRVSELAITKAMAANYTVAPQNLLSKGLFAPVKNMVKHVQIAGVNLTIDPSLPTFEDDAFIAEITRRANLKFSNKG